jgi:GNAT superfamily N-acetyltransferase
MHIRTGGPSDLVYLVAASCAMARETEALELDSLLVCDGISNGLARAPEVQYWIAEDGGAPVGCLYVTREWSDWRNGWYWWIQGVYVDLEARGRGVYRQLHNAVMAAAREAGDVRAVRLYVDRDNLAAQKTYAALGMEHSHYDIFETAC